MTDILKRDETVPQRLFGYRLDQAAAELMPEFSRERLKQWIQQGALTLDGMAVRPRDKVLGGERLRLETQLEEETRWVAQAIELDIVYEDASVIVLDKAAGMVVHPAAGNPDGTLLNALLHRYPELVSVPRAGIVHRLDKDTTGLMMVARTLEAQNALVTQLQARTVSREYDAVVVGAMTAGGRVEAPIGRHPRDRQRQAVTDSGKPAVTHYRIGERYRAHTHVRCRLETGRTHQIRVHMGHLRYPLVGDPLYGGRPKLPPGASETLKAALREFPRQALHARRLAFEHPASGEPMGFETSLPTDLLALLGALRDDREAFA